MASKNQQLMAERLAKKNVVVAAAKRGKHVAEASGSQGAGDPKAKRPRIEAIPERQIPEKRPPQPMLKSSASIVTPP
ncbi:sodium-dependent lysophosphatidylcholine symporter 1-A isoform [Sesbania bispinosa]|nr:sodium-dependent lysophosphatidylcholine symporter 1-A isoform [Sesbania bispinosa]